MHDDMVRDNERLRRLLQLHAGDVMSLTNELDEWRYRALAAEEELAVERLSVTPVSDNINHKVYQAIGNITIPVTTAEGHKISAYLSEKAVAQIWLALRERGLDIIVA